MTVKYTLLLHVYNSYLIIHNVVIFQRQLYYNVFKNTEAIIYMVEENENMVDRIRRAMHDISRHESLEGVPVLVVANKEETHSENFMELMQDKLNLNKLKMCDWRNYLKNVELSMII